jgi:hypothetical protein
LPEVLLARAPTCPHRSHASQSVRRKCTHNHTVSTCAMDRLCKCTLLARSLGALLFLKRYSRSVVLEVREDLRPALRVALLHARDHVRGVRARVVRVLRRQLRDAPKPWVLYDEVP